VTPEVKNLALKNPSTGQIWELARQQGSASLFEDGIEKVKGGLTTLEEVFRVAPPSESGSGIIKEKNQAQP
jgi:type II secretory ATPase GspE/PulE/Tfp pilus assembly ATPase PilB-like protein